MKIKKTMSKKIIVSTLSTVMGVSLVGAITGTVAWYQYSTRSTVSYVGTTVGSSRNLLVSADGNEFKPDLKREDLNSHAHNLYPITTGDQSKDAALSSDINGTIFHAQPVYQYFNYNDWIRADADMFVQFPIYLKYNEVLEDGSKDIVKEMKNVHLTNVVIQDDVNNTKADISDAIRVHLHTEQGNMLISKKGEDTAVFGTLDLNNDGVLDDNKPAYDFIDHNEPVNYGAEGAFQNAFRADALPDLVIGTLFAKKVHLAKNANLDELNENEDVYFTDETLETAASGIVAEEEGKDFYVSQPVLTITVTIWLEGWQKLANVESKALPENYNLDLVYFNNADLAAEHKVAAGTVANGSDHYYVDDGNGGVEEVTPAEGQVLNVVWYTSNKLTTEASGLVPQGGATYYYNKGDSAMWEIVDYVNSMFDVGLLFEVEETF